MIGIGEIVLSEPCGRDEALGVGDTPGEPGWTLTTLSFDVRFGDSLAGKLRVFVHCDKLRTILTVHKHYTFTELEETTRALHTAAGGRMGSAMPSTKLQPVQVATCTHRASMCAWGVHPCA